MTTTRKPAITRTAGHPADTIPDRPATHTTALADDRQERREVARPPEPAAERLIEQHNVRIRPSVKNRLTKAVDKLRYETGDRTISLASITDEAIDAYLAERGC